MDSEAKIIIAFLFNRSGKTSLTESEIYLPLSMELGWLSTKESQEFVKYAVQQGFLVKKEGALQPNFPLDTVAIPLGFTPSKRLFPIPAGEQEGTLIEGVISQICTQTALSQKEIHEEITPEEKDKHLLLEVAALYVARKHGVDVTAWHDAVERIILRENKG
jgi:hypothetical protein